MSPDPRERLKMSTSPLVEADHIEEKKEVLSITNNVGVEGLDSHEIPNCIRWNPELKSLISKIKNRLIRNKVHFFRSPRALESKRKDIIRKSRAFS